jgi:hypothetical protein
VPQFYRVTIFRLAGQLIIRLSINEMQVNVTQLVIQNGIYVSSGGAVLASDSLCFTLINDVSSTALVT